MIDPNVKVESPEVGADLPAIALAVRTVAHRSEGDAISLLLLLRTLESLHTEIRDSLFQASLPENRQQLYALLRDIEASGGWPYIPRMRLRSLLEHLETEQIDTASAQSHPRGNH